MTLTLTTLPKEAKPLPPEGQRLFLDAYNKDFGWRCSESHAEKAAWRVVRDRYQQDAAGAWSAKP